jgi:hypothetical protein
VQHCREGNWEVGLQLLRKVARKEEKETRLPSVYYGFFGYGVARFEGERRKGLALCRHAVRLGPREPDNWLNLARIHVLVGGRRRAVTALQKGLALDPSHPTLLALRREIGFRRKPVVPFLSRDARINRYLGARRHQRLEAKRQAS